MWRSNKSSVPAMWPMFAPERDIRKPATDDTRRHAVNWFLGVTTLAACASTTAWWLLYRGGWASVDGLITIAPLSVSVGVGFAAWQLLTYTRQYREWLYTQAESRDASPRKGHNMQRAAGTLLRGADGVLQRVEVELSEDEIAAIKKTLLRDNGCSVRTLTPLVHERASALRAELHQIGVLAELREKSATPLTPAGKKAVMRW